MRFGFSNLIFNALSNDAKRAILSASEVCDFAPTVHYKNWQNVPHTIQGKPYTGFDTEISALQSLFYQVDGASLVQGEHDYLKLYAHMKYLVDLASRSDIPFLIFGSPGTRSQISQDVNLEVIARRLLRLADLAGLKNLKICIEVNSSKFGCEYITTNQFLFDLLTDLSHRGLGLHLDVGQMIEEKLDPLQVIDHCKSKLSHLHLSAPDFSLQPSMLNLYKDVILALKTSPVDVILEVQSLGQHREDVLVDLVCKLSEV